MRPAWKIYFCFPKSLVWGQTSSGLREHRSGYADCGPLAKGLCTQAAIVWSRKSVLPTDRKGWGRICTGMSAREGEMMSRQP